MHAVTVTSDGALGWTEVQTPRPEANEVLIRVAASALNRADILQRKGLYPPPAGASQVLGLECAGEIVEVGEGVSAHHIGEQVCALLDGGGYAEYVCVDRTLTLPVPQDMSVAVAAALPEVAATVWSNLVMVGQAQPGTAVLVHGGASGIGTTAIQAAVALGCRVFATAGTEAKVKFCVELGAEQAWDYREEDLPFLVLEATGGRGADLVLDNVGPNNLDRNIGLLARGGRIVIIGSQGGRQGSFNIGPLMAKQATVHATSLRQRGRAEKGEIVRATQAAFWPLIESRKLLPVVDSQFPMSDALAAHKHLESGVHIGKVLLTQQPNRAPDSLGGSHPLSPARHAATVG
ncbi:NAD(P)H-quinone oxidoreductase [Micromonospora sp. AP08]|uniref:NAD(P)H-quinone oxidoreductase n=1 Tax=Micromonospora sp. AP08 TaxID=2604467 RepID=UPI0011DB5FF6|nr:NAD(P)H-quinone oxidoreductase [Micromonospora sp. AP08]TYB39709.1 NAD(P)H-quinone oxidoreductase [Micromonospora sp. AP08]